MPTLSLLTQHHRKTNRFFPFTELALSSNESLLGFPCQLYSRRRLLYLVLDLIGLTVGQTRVS